MKRVIIYALLACNLAACTPTTVGIGNNSASTNPAAVQCNGFQATALDDKAMFAAETAYNIPANAYVTLNNSGHLSDSWKATAKPILTKMAGYLGDARTAYSVGDACTFAAKLQALKQAKAQIEAAVPAIAALDVANPNNPVTR